MILKITGSLMVILASAFIGCALSGNYSARPRQLRELQCLFKMLENEISFLSNLLADAFTRICETSRCDTAKFFANAAAHMRSNPSLTASQAWEAAIDDIIGKTALDEEDKAILVSFGKLLGNSDTEGQIKNIELVLSQLKQQENKAEEQRLKNAAMYRRLGVLGGIAIVIILL